MIQIVVNGDARETSDGINVVALLQELGLNSGRVAIERNRQILSREKWADTLVQAGDQYEIVQFVGGG